MKRILLNIKSKIVRQLLKGFSLSAMLFVFQACYGTQQDIDRDVKVEGIVKSDISGKPIQDIRVSLLGSSQHIFTDEEGKFVMYVPSYPEFTVQFADIDSIDNGHFNDFDTLIKSNDNEVFLNIVLESK